MLNECLRFYTHNQFDLATLNSNLPWTPVTSPVLLSVLKSFAIISTWFLFYPHLRPFCYRCTIYVYYWDSHLQTRVPKQQCLVITIRWDRVLDSKIGFINIQHLYPKMDQLGTLFVYENSVLNISAINETF